MPIDNSSRFPKPLAADLLELSEGMAIVIDGDTAPRAITAGQYLFIKNHSTLATGGYHATAAIASGASITSSNVTADADGIVNGAVSALNGNLASLTRASAFTRIVQGRATVGNKTYKYSGLSFTLTRLAYVVVTQNYNNTQPRGISISNSSSSNQSAFSFTSPTAMQSMSINAILLPGTYYLWFMGEAEAGNDIWADALYLQD